MSKLVAKPISKHNTRKRNSFPWEVAVYSTVSAIACRDGILKLLRHYRIPSSKITVFVPAGQENQYTTVLKPGTYATVVGATCELNVFINDFYAVGTPVIHTRDTVRGFLEVGSRILKSLVGVIQTGFQECEKQGAHLWGLYPHAVGGLLRPTISRDLHPIQGCFWGCISLGSNWISYQVPEQADYERSILYFQRDKAVIRLNFVAAFCSPNKTSSASKRKMAVLYPDYVRLVTNKKGILEIRLRTPDRFKGDKPH